MTKLHDEVYRVTTWGTHVLYVLSYLGINLIAFGSGFVAVWVFMSPVWPLTSIALITLILYWPFYRTMSGMLLDYWR